MTNIALRPALKTAGGEVTELLLDGRFVGMMTLVYRENGRLAGSVQLEKESLAGKWKMEAVQAAQSYIRHLTEALGAEDCEVIVTWSSYEHMITFGEQTDVDELLDERALFEEDEDTWLGDVEPDEIDTMLMEEEDLFSGELVVVGESRNRIEYHFYGGDGEWLAEAFALLNGTDVAAEVDWKIGPSEEEAESLTEQLVADFDPDEVDSFYIEMLVDGVVVETLELTHEDLLDEDEPGINEYTAEQPGANALDYSVILTRDDGDTLTYDLYKQSHGGLPIAQATIDVSRRELTGFIDFHDPESLDKREWIGALLMRELDKEKDYDTLNLSMLLANKLVDDIWYETETYH